MSDVQLYLFEVDKNKKEATSIAESSARRKILLCRNESLTYQLV